MTKNIAVVAYEKHTAKIYGEQLSFLFKKLINVDYYSVEESSFTNIHADIIIASTYSIYELVKRYSDNYTNVIIADITLKKQSLDKLKYIPDKTKAMLINSTLEMCVETIGLIYNSGAQHIDLIPVYPNMKNIPDLEIAITPGEIQLVPSGVSTIIDLGNRVLSMRTIVNIAVKLDLSYILQSEAFKNYFKSLANSDLGIEELYGRVNDLEKKLDLILKIFDDGVIAIGQDRKINFINRFAKNMLDLGDNIIGHKIEDVIKEFDEIDFSIQSAITKDKVFKIKEQHLVISVYPISNLLHSINYIILIRKFTDTEKEQNRIRKQVISKGHIVKYNFKNIIGESKEIKKVKEKARKIALSDSSIFINGKSGTGKELFAQSIHYSSYRKNNPFIAINCASIPENLLESELFGYEEGAFTGARKGGKAGYFELAHMGTLFLDEISEMSLTLQARMLRVLQEMEINRIGGSNIINIDVRIISASNKDLENMVRENKFREDLYYRINVLRLNIPPLNERKEDIPILIEHFKNTFNVDYKVSEDAMEVIKNHNWHGNIRELKNFVERLIYIDKENILVDDIYECLDLNLNEDILFCTKDEKYKFELFIKNNKDSLNRIYHVLDILSENKNEKILGRRSIAQTLNEQEIFISDQQVRTVLKILRDNNMIRISKGRGGTEITGLGLKMFNLLQDQFNNNII